MLRGRIGRYSCLDLHLFCPCYIFLFLFPRRFFSFPFFFFLSAFLDFLSFALTL